MKIYILNKLGHLLGVCVTIFMFCLGFGFDYPQVMFASFLGWAYYTAFNTLCQADVFVQDRMVNHHEDLLVAIKAFYKQQGKKKLMDAVWNLWGIALFILLTIVF